MKTKDFIKMLQKADPTGEGYIRLPGGGAPWFAEVKEGYWDGSYQYLELGDEKKYYPHDSILVTSIKGYKVDINVMETDSIIWDENGDIERIKKRLRFEFDGYHPNQVKEKINKLWNDIEKEASNAKKFHEKSTTEWSENVIKKFFNEKDRWEIRQPLDTKIGWANHMIAYQSKFLGLTIEKHQLCQGECLAIIESGKFYYEKGNEYYVWKYDPEKGKNWSLKQ